MCPERDGQVCGDYLETLIIIVCCVHSLFLKLEVYEKSFYKLRRYVRLRVHKIHSL